MAIIVHFVSLVFFCAQPASVPDNDISNPYDIKHQVHAKTKEEALDALGRLGMMPLGGGPIVPQRDSASSSPDEEKQNLENEKAEKLPEPVPRRNLQPKPRPRSTIEASALPPPRPRPRPQSTLIPVGSGMGTSQTKNAPFPAKQPRSEGTLDREMPRLPPRRTSKVILEEQIVSSSSTQSVSSPLPVQGVPLNTGPPRSVPPKPVKRQNSRADTSPSKPYSYVPQGSNENVPQLPPVRKGHTLERCSAVNSYQPVDSLPAQQRTTEDTKFVNRPMRKAPSVPPGKRKTASQRSMTLPPGSSLSSQKLTDIDLLFSSDSGDVTVPLVPQLPAPLIPESVPPAGRPPKLPPRNPPPP